MFRYAAAATFAQAMFKTKLSNSFCIDDCTSPKMETSSFFSELSDVKEIIILMVQYCKSLSLERLSWFVAPTDFDQQESERYIV